MAARILLVTGALMALSSAVMCGAAATDGTGFSPGGFLLCLVGLLVYGAGRFAGSLSAKDGQK